MADVEENSSRAPGLEARTWHHVRARDLVPSFLQPLISDCEFVRGYSPDVREPTEVSF